MKVVRIKILITGGAGFLGYHLANHLKNDHEVELVDNLSRGKHDEDFNTLLEHDNVTFKRCDLNSYKNLETLDNDYQYIFHLAARNGTINFYEYPYEVARTNILTLMHMLDWMGKNYCKPKKFIFTSSSETYARTPNIQIPTPENVLLTIDDVFNPRLSYAGSKIAGEILLTNYAKQYELNYDIVRPHNIYGPRMGYDHVIPEFIKRILDKENPFTIYGGHETRSFCYVDDFVDGICKVAFNDSSRQVYHIGNPKETRIIDLANMMFVSFNHNPQLKILPVLKGSCMKRCPDITKISKLGYEPKVELEDGLRKTFEWYKVHDE
jgi:nucleoside-diphosphate-sugar epimerase